MQSDVYSIDLYDGWNPTKKELTLCGARYHGVFDISKPKLDMRSLLAPDDGYIDGNAIINSMFQERSPDVFISHSHQDIELAIAFADFLSQQFKIGAFVDALYWGDSDELLKKLDNRYCRNEHPHDTYSYKKRNVTTSHVHMMLAAALAKVMRESKVVFYLKPYKSSSYNFADIDNENGELATESPWIFLELTLANLFFKKQPTPALESFSAKRAEVAPIRYQITDKFPELTSGDMQRWVNRFKECHDRNLPALEVLKHIK